MWITPKTTPRQSDTVICRGGLDVSTPSRSIDPGKLVSAMNYEVMVGNGYRRISGIERFDGRTAPSSATYTLIWGPFTTVGIGDTVNAHPSGSTGKVLAVYPNLMSQQALVVTRVTGPFPIGETLRIGSTPVGTITAQPATYQQDPFADLDWLYLASQEYRSSITRPPGSGGIRGVWSLGNTVYCVRNNAAATAGVMYASSATGWTAVSLGFSIPFNLGNTGTPIVVGNTVTGGTSGASAVITRVVVEGGDVGFTSGNPARGQLICASITGGPFVSGEELRVSGVRRANAAGGSVAHQLPLDGVYETRTHNFFGASSMKEVYGVNGAGRAFAFNGSVFHFINSGQAAPRHIEVHGGRLVLAEGAEIAISSIESPYRFDGPTGAVSIAVGGTISGMIRVPGSSESASTLIATIDNGVFVLYGSSDADYAVVPAGPEKSIATRSLQAIGTPIAFDKTGLTQVLQTSAYGNFAFGSISTEYNRALLPQFNGVRASVTVPSKNMYRLFFSNGSVLALTMVGTKPMGAILCDYNGRVARCAYLSDINTESVFIGCDDGFVYQLDKGSSIDGENIRSWLKFAPNFGGSYSTRKRYFGADFEVTPTSAFRLSVAPLLSFGRGDNAEHAPDEILSTGLGGLWDDALWDQFYWDGGGDFRYHIDLNGSGNSISFILTDESKKFFPWIIESYTVRYRTRREDR